MRDGGGRRSMVGQLIVMERTIVAGAATVTSAGDGRPEAFLFRINNIPFCSCALDFCRQFFTMIFLSLSFLVAIAFRYNPMVCYSLKRESPPQIGSGDLILFLFLCCFNGVIAEHIPHRGEVGAFRETRFFYVYH